MGVTIDIGLPGDVPADVLALPVASDGDVDARFAALRKGGELRGDRGEAPVLHGSERVVAAGVGARADVDLDALRTAGAAAAKALERVGGSICWQLDESLPLSLADQARALVEGTVLGAYSPGRWKTNGDRPRTF